MEKEYKEKLLEQQRNIDTLHQQIDQLRKECDQQQKELSDLKEKYAQKSRFSLFLKKSLVFHRKLTSLSF